MKKRVSSDLSCDHSNVSIQSLQQQIQRYEKLLQTVTGYIYMVEVQNGQAIRTFHGAGCVHVTGYEPKEFADNPQLWYEIIHPEDCILVTQYFEHIINGKVMQPLEHRIIHKDRSIRWVCNTSVLHVDEQGHVISYDGLITDITVRKEMEETLRKNEHAFRTLIEYNADPMVVIQQGIIRFANPAAGKAFGLSLDELIGLELGIPSTIDKQIELDLVNRLGEHRIAEALIVPIEWESQSAYLATFRDITSRKRTEEELEQQVAERTMLLQQAIAQLQEELYKRKQTEIELRQAREAAEKTARVKSDFLAKMSHEIRTPLNAIIGMTDLLLETPLNPEQYDFAHTAHVSGEVLLTIINDILDFSKIEAGKVKLERQPFNLRECIEQSLDLISPKAAEKELDLAYFMDEAVPEFVVGDMARLQQILVNLLSNAVKFTNQGEVVVTAMLDQYVARADNTLEHTASVPHTTSFPIHFCIRDTGIGIPSDSIQQLFQPFTQVETSTVHGGTGLGLSISKRFAEMMGGTVYVESEVGKGSSFHVIIQVEQCECANEYCVNRSPADQLSKENMHYEQLLGKRVLFVDDNATNRFIFERQSQSWKMESTIVKSAADALDKIKQGEVFDLVIVDMNMPDMDGLGLISTIRTLEEQGMEIRTQKNDRSLSHFQHSSFTPEFQTKRVPIIMYTSITLKTEAMRQARREVDVFLTKPIKPAQLCNVIIQICTGQPVKDELHMTHLPHLSIAQQHPLRILLAEDNVVNQKVAIAMLDKMGYCADIASNGEEVLHAVMQQPYDVILMDVMMPKMDGILTTRHVREMFPSYQQPWIVAMTAQALEGDRQRLLDSGMDDYVSKPVRPEELMRALLRGYRQKSDLLTTHTVFPPPHHPIGSAPKVPKPSLDRSVFDHFVKRIRNIEHGLAQELIDIFLQDTPVLLNEIRQALEQNDVETWTRAAHTLKSTSAQLGAIPLSHLCREMETMGKENNLQDALQQQRKIGLEYERVAHMLHELKQTL